MEERTVEEDATSGEPTLDELGLDPGEPVRWRRQAGARWNQGTIIQREADGSVAVRDGNGAWRSIPVERLEAQTVTRRGAKRWQALAVRAEQARRAQQELAESREDGVAQQVGEVRSAAGDQQAELKLW